MVRAGRSAAGSVCVLLIVASPVLAGASTLVLVDPGVHPSAMGGVPEAELAQNIAAYARKANVDGIVDLLRPPSDGSILGALTHGLYLSGTPVPSPLSVQGESAGASNPWPLTSAVSSVYESLRLPPLRPSEVASMRSDEILMQHAFAGVVAELVLALRDHLGVGEPTSLRADSPEAAVSALRIARAVDYVALKLQTYAPIAPMSQGEGGFLFADPYHLVLVGDAGSSTYSGNRLGSMAPISPRYNLLTVDLGGDDLYTNNAGGAGLDLSYPLDALGYPAAAVSIDFAGDDTYSAVYENDEETLQIAQGAAGEGGVGILLDMAGDDAYRAETSDVVSSALLVQGSSGGEVVPGIGILMDLSGTDSYTAVSNSSGRSGITAQGAGLLGLGLLFDLEGSDVYTASSIGPTAKGVAQGSGGNSLLYDGDGDDVYVSSTNSFSGYGTFVFSQGSDGLLIDEKGNDRYLSRVHMVRVEEGAQDYFSRHHGQGYSGIGVGALLDLGGDDVYRLETEMEFHVKGGFNGQLGQGVSEGGVGLLLDSEGNDTYVASAHQIGLVAGGHARQFAQGAMEGILMDAGGHDSYKLMAIQFGEMTSEQIGQGSGTVLFVDNSDFLLPGMMVELGGDDHYEAFHWASGDATQFVQAGGYGVLTDCSGEDVYVATQAVLGTRRQLAQGAADEEGLAVLFDGGGHDSYTGPGEDGTMWMQGVGGIGVDQGGSFFVAANLSGAVNGEHLAVSITGNAMSWSDETCIALSATGHANAASVSLI